MMIKVDPKSPILWVRVRGLDGWRSFVLSEVTPRTPLKPEPREWRLLTLHDDSNDRVLPVMLTVDATKTRLVAAKLRLYGTFAPENDAPIMVEFFQPKEARGAELPAPALTVALKTDEDYMAVVDIALEAR